MRRRFLLLSALVLPMAFTLLAPALAQDTKFYAPPIVSVPKVKVAPKMDGAIDPAEWAAAAPLAPFVLLGGHGQPSKQTQVWVMYDDHNLYVAALLKDPHPGTLKMAATDRDGAVWDDDSFELFFDTDDQRKSYIHLAVNAAGVQYDAYMKDKTADYRWTAKTEVLADGWSVELALPFANDFPPAAGISWGFSAGRHSTSDNQFSAWNRDVESFHEVENFGSLKFADKPLALDIANLGALWLGHNTAQALVRNTDNRAASCKANVRVLGRDKFGDFNGVTKLTVPGGGQQPIKLPYGAREDGFSTVAFSLSDASGQTVWRSSPYAINAPEIAPQIAAIEKSLAAATRACLKLPEGETKKSLQSDLDGLTVQWRYLVAQYANRAKLQAADLDGLAQYADKLKGDAEMLEKQIDSAKASARPEAKFGVSAVTSLTQVFSEQFGVAGQPSVQLDCCKNDRESAQLVVLPFC